MKKAIMIGAMALLAFSDQSQAQVKIKTTFRTIVPRNLQECDILGSTAGYGSVSFTQIGIKFTVVGIIKAPTKQYIVQAWQWKIEESIKGSIGKGLLLIPKPQPAVQALAKAKGIAMGSNVEKYMQYNYYTDAANNLQRRYFLVSEAEIADYTEPILPYFQATGGAATLPFKYRISTGSFDQNLSISGLAGVKHTYINHKTLSYAVLVGIGLASISLDSSNSSVQSNANLSAISLSAGVVLQYQALQFGAFLGVDKISNNKVYQWNSQGKPWFGLGIGFSIFSPTAAENQKEGKNGE